MSPLIASVLWYKILQRLRCTPGTSRAVLAVLHIIRQIILHCSWHNRHNNCRYSTLTATNALSSTASSNRNTSMVSAFIFCIQVNQQCYVHTPIHHFLAHNPANVLNALYPMDHAIEIFQHACQAASQHATSCQPETADQVAGFPHDVGTLHPHAMVVASSHACVCMARAAASTCKQLGSRPSLL